MGVELIIRRNGDPGASDYEPIREDEWLALVERDPALSIRTEDHIARHPRTGEEIMRMRARPAESELSVADRKVPFLRYWSGTLMVGYGDSLDDENDPARRKIVEIAQLLNAHIGHDAGDDTLDW